MSMIDLFGLDSLDIPLGLRLLSLPITPIMTMAVLLGIAVITIGLIIQSILGEYILLIIQVIGQ